MKTYVAVVLIVLAVICSCKTNNINGTGSTAGKGAAAAGTANDTVRIANDTLEYEIIIIDPGFNGWMATRAKPRNYYSQQYLENKNRMWVVEWNIRTQNPLRYRDLYQMQIDYSPNINYGYEVNYMLYNYLVYFQLTNRQRLGGIVPEF